MKYLDRNKPIILYTTKIEQDSEAKYQQYITHKLFLTQEDEEVWLQKIEELRPDIIVIGPCNFTRNMLTKWKKTCLEKNLTLIQRGTNTSRIDIEAAKELNIRVKNTPGANSPYVAKYMFDFINNPQIEIKKLAINPFGAIGRYLTDAAITQKIKPFIYSPSLLNAESRQEQLDKYKVPEDQVICVKDIGEVFKDSTHIAISLPINDNTRNIIKIEHIKSIASNAKLISVSPIAVFDKEAIKELCLREDINVVFDGMKDQLKASLAGFIDVKDIRPNFIIQGEAATTNEAQRAMDDAVFAHIHTIFENLNNTREYR
ncbi:MAG: NAD(P)-dependent oxidoreductase [Alphaproteobacteria bacterium]